MSNIPDFQSVMLPYLDLLADGREMSVKEATQALADHFSLTAEQREEMMPSGVQTIFGNRTAWAKTHLKQAGLLSNAVRGRVSISDAGKTVIAGHPTKVNCALLKQFPSYLLFIGQASQSEVAVDGQATLVESAETPAELIDKAFETLRKATAEELLIRLKGNSPAFFERAVVRLLRAMGYGISGDASVTGASHDGGIDGIIREDKLGLDSVCVQAKRWEGTVGRPVVQQFVGSMDVERSRKGVIITTSTFSREAIDYINRIEGKKVVLIDGPRLAELMLEYNVGVIVTKVYEIKDISNDFFDEEEG